jgi:hypothetical protein
MRQPDTRIRIQTPYEDIFLNNPHIDLCAESVEQSEGETFVNLDGCDSKKMHVMDLFALMVLGDTRIMDRSYEVCLDQDEVEEMKGLGRGLKNPVVACLDGFRKYDGLLGEVLDYLRDADYDVIYLDEQHITMRKSLAVISRCDLFVGMECDMSYIAMCSDVPMVVCFENHPWNSFPFRRGLPFEYFQDQGKVTIEDFTEAIEKVTT